jgi:N-acyl-D-aspartate/D-glutamate deacylase
LGLGELPRVWFAFVQHSLGRLYDLILESSASAMLMHPAGVLGLSDGGAHCGLICDASYPTFLLTHRARDRSRGEQLLLEYVIRKQSRNTAQLFGLTDRGTIEPGKKADINAIDMDALTLRPAAIVLANSRPAVTEFCREPAATRRPSSAEW